MEKKELTKKLENFFYYYKWQTFFVVLGIILVIITVRQVTARIDYDTRIVFGGKITAIDPDIQSFNSKVKELFADSNGDGEVNVLTLSLIHISSRNSRRLSRTLTRPISRRIRCWESKRNWM